MATKLSFALNAKLDLYDEEDKGWLIATVTETTKDEIKIHFLQWGDGYDTWITKNSPNLALLHTHTAPITFLSQPPKSEMPVSTIVVHQQKLIYLTSHGPFQYDMISDTHTRHPMNFI